MRLESGGERKGETPLGRAGLNVVNLRTATVAARTMQSPGVRICIHQSRSAVVEREPKQGIVRG